MEDMSLGEVVVMLQKHESESRKMDMLSWLDTMVESGWISKEERAKYLVMAEHDLNGTVDMVFERYGAYKDRERTRGGVGIHKGPGGSLVYPMKDGQVANLEGIYNGCGELLKHYSVDATGFDSRMFMRMWREDIIEGTFRINRALRDGEDSVAKCVLGSNPSNRDIVMFTIAALVRTRSKRRTAKDKAGGWWHVLTGIPKRFSEFGQGSNLCSTEAIVAQLLCMLYGIDGELKLTKIKPNEPHNYFQSHDYPGDSHGPIIDISGCPHLWGFVKNPADYTVEVQRGQAWLKARRASKIASNGDSSLTDFDREFIDFSLARF